MDITAMKQGCMHGILSGVLVAWVAMAPLQIQAQPLSQTAVLSTDKVIRGEAAVLRITPQAGRVLPDLQVSFLNQTLKPGKVQLDDPSVYYVLPVDYYTQPGMYSVRIEDTAHHQVQTLPIRVLVGDYPKETLSVDPKFTKLSPELAARAEREMKYIAQVYASYEPMDEILRPLVFPMHSAITSPYGIQRIFNHEVKSYHNGIDFRADVGAPVQAAADGRVLLAENLFYSGNHVALDHGAGVVSTYSHLSKITVQPGADVKLGDVIGYTGRTGRVTGPHLHFAVKCDGIAVDPITTQKVLSSIAER